MVSGDTVYVGAGFYREAISVGMVSPTLETFIIGDNDGSKTGDPGEIVITNYVLGWYDQPSSQQQVIGINGRQHLTFRNLFVVGGGACYPVFANAVSRYIKFDNCVLVSYGTGYTVWANAAFGVPLDWTIVRCQVVVLNASAMNIYIIAPWGTGADYDLNFQVTDSFLWSLAYAGYVTSSGTGANKGGGVDFLHCTILGQIGTAANATSLTLPCTVQDCVSYSGISLNAGTLGQITDLGGNVCTGSYTNVTAHATSRNTNHDFPTPLYSLAHEWMWGMPPRRFMSPMYPPVMTRGVTNLTGVTDLENRPRPEGISLWCDSGTASSATATTLVDAAKNWGNAEHNGRLVRITGGTGIGQVKQISSSTATTLTIGTLSGDWEVLPNATSTYIIYEGPPVESAKASSGTVSTFVVATANWTVNKWAGYTLGIIGGTNNAVTRTIASNTATTLTTVTPFPVAIDATSIGNIYWIGTSMTATQRTPGAFELHDDARKESVVVDAGGTGITISGPGSHEFDIPVDALATIITVRYRYDVNHGVTNKPQLQLVQNLECGVNGQLITGVALADTWATLTLATFTPTKKGIVSVRVIARSATPYGRCFFDSFTVS